MTTIAIVTNSLSGGGAERAMNLLADNLSKYEDLNVLLIPINAGPRDLVEPRCDISEIQRVWQGGIWNTIKAFTKFQRAILKFNPSFLILNCDLPEFFSALSIWKAKCIIVEHTTRPWSGRRNIGNFVRLILKLRGANYVRVSSRINVSSVFNDILVIPNIIDPKVINPHAKPYFENDLPGKLLFIGRLSQEKRPDLFIELARISAMESLVIGDGQLRSELQSFSKNLANLKFLGHQLNPWQYASKRDLLVLTSEYEGDGLVALEAISIGIPVALRKSQDLQKIGLPDNNYFEDISTLAKDIKLSGFQKYELSELERHRILKNRNPNEVSQLWLKFLRSLE